MIPHIEGDDKDRIGAANKADGEYYFLPVDFRYRDQASISWQGISRKQILEDLLKVTAEKSILFFDTCNSGSFLSTPASRGLTKRRPWMG